MRILLAVDGSAYSDAATQAVISQFRREGLEVHVVCVVEPVTTLEPPQMAPGYYPELADQVREARVLVERTARMLADGGVKASTDVREGEAKTIILEEADAWEADLVVLGSHGKKGLRRFLLGSVSEAVARHANCSVEIVRSNAG